METLELSLITPRVSLIAAAENYGRFAIAPLQRGHASSLGNALRRVLISSIPGAAITRIKVAGVIHEFTAIPGVVEDGTQLVLNVKGIRLRSYSDRAVALQLVKHGPGPVFAGDIDTPSTVEIVNPQHYLCTIDDENTTLEMQLTVERGRGVQLADTVSGMPIGEIAVDALFSPIPRVNFLVEEMGDDPLTGYDRLILEIWTDGTIKPGDALSHAAQVLTQYFGRIVSLSQPEEPEQQPNLPPPIPEEIANRTIDELGLSTRTYNSLRRAEIHTIGQLLRLDDRGLMGIRNLGAKGIEEIHHRLEALGYRSGEAASGRLPASSADHTTPPTGATHAEEL
ncbi:MULTISPECIES: DNA-directed RNA polymerase subunit alpha [Chloroflexus]|uniref:DNA-directed RNA polymerase subunit alpha n=1 Tax=Chloroflexus islandicus TaxID=1707952 RepID=A0A178MIE4_9CHLR|nr:MULTISPECIES: DNA-directed RNA polymerase subunit alpha [Chloroflexus]OAN47784.1 DNA-directed RNA polymerase subunit alpha [Chloroflexus islandicus]